MYYKQEIEEHFLFTHFVSSVQRKFWLSSHIRFYAFVVTAYVMKSQAARCVKMQLLSSLQESVLHRKGWYSDCKRQYRNVGYYLHIHVAYHAIALLSLSACTPSGVSNSIQQRTYSVCVWYIRSPVEVCTLHAPLRNTVRGLENIRETCKDF